MFTNLRQALGKAAEVVYPVLAAYGAFELKRDVEVGLHDGTHAIKRRYEASDDFTALGHYLVTIEEPVDDPRGLSQKLIGEDGYVTAALFSAQVLTTGTVSRTAHLNIVNTPESYIRAESHISLLVCLLSSYYVQTAKEVHASQDLRDYDDGHLKVNIMDMFAPAPTHTDMLADESIAIRPHSMGNTDDELTEPVLALNGVNAKYVDLILWHLNGRQRTTRFAFDLEIPPLAQSASASGATISIRGIKKPTKYSAVDLRGAINQYVTSNRLYSSFEVALALYQQMALTPLPDHAEGYAWLRRKKTLILPRFDTSRGAYKFMMLGESFGVTATMTATFEYWRNHGLACAVQGGMFNALSLWGRYLAEGGYFHPDAGVRNRLGENKITEVPGAAYYAYAAIITGNETYCPVPRSIGVRYDTWSEDLLDSIEVTVLDVAARGYDLLTTHDVDSLLVREVPTPCSAVHVLGRLPQEGMFSCLSDRFVIKATSTPDGWVLPNVSSAWGLAMVTRWFGYDTEMTYKGQTKIANWAPNSSSIAARPFFTKGSDIQTVFVNGIAPRKKVYRQLPYMGAGESSWQIDVAVADCFTVVSHSGKRLATMGAFAPRYGKDEGKFLVNMAVDMSYAEITISVDNRSSTVEAGFRLVMPDQVGIPPDPPVIAALEAEAEPIPVEDPGAVAA
jgi:hypothetical protein